MYDAFIKAGQIFMHLINISIAASWLVLAVIILRFILKKVPKWVNCLLWGIVAIRLLMPFSIKSIFSLIPSSETLPIKNIYAQNPNIADNPYYYRIDSGLDIIDELADPIMTDATPEAMRSNFSIFACIWLVGIIALLSYALISYLRIRSKVCEAAPMRGNIWLCDRISTPFIFGVIRPRIYLPSDIKEQDAEYVIAHEKAHLKRRDHWWKPLGFFLLTVYWFNPILWLAYILLCRDIELACDERVIKILGIEIKKNYSDALINCSVPRRMISACPLAFGEVGVKERIRAVLNYKRPAFWVVAASVIVCVGVAVCFLTDPAGIRITALNDCGDYSGIFDDMQEITVFNGEEGYCTTEEAAVNSVVAVLQEVKIGKKPISKSRSEDRAMTNRIVLNYVTLCFNADYSELWISNSVKPTLSYKVLTTERVKEAFDIVLNSVNKEKSAENIGVLISDEEKEENFKFTEFDNEEKENDITSYGTTTEEFSDPKISIYNKMLNTIDYFNEVELTLETSMLNGDICSIYYHTNIDDGIAYEAVLKNGSTLYEDYCAGDSLIEVDNAAKTVKREYFPNYKRSDSPYIPLEKRVVIQEDGIPGYYYRQNISRCGFSSYSIVPQEMAFSYLADFERWKIADENVEYLGRSCIKISGNPTAYSGGKHNCDSFTMLVDSETGILMSFEGIKNGSVTNFITVKEVSFEAGAPIKQYDESEYGSYTEEYRTH